MKGCYADDPDVQLMLRVRDGDELAFAELVQRHAQALFDFVLRYVGDRQHAEDVAQDCFLKVFRAASRYEPTARFRTWLFTIATRRCLNHRRWSLRRRHVSVERAGEEEGRGPLELPAAGEDPTQGIEETELRQRVRAAVRDLPRRQRMALVLHRYEGLSLAEIGEVMGLRMGAVKSLLNRARESLRRRLAGDLELYAPARREVSEVRR